MHANLLDHEVAPFRYARLLKIMAWNVRGAKSNARISGIQEIVNLHHLDVLLLLETRLHASAGYMPYTTPCHMKEWFALRVMDNVMV